MPVLDEDDPETAGERRVSHMSLTRYLPALPDRKDRMSTADVLADAGSPVLPLLDTARARRVVERSSAGRPSKPHTRGGVERVLWLDEWMRDHSVSLGLS